MQGAYCDLKENSKTCHVGYFPTGQPVEQFGEEFKKVIDGVGGYVRDKFAAKA